MVRFSAVFIDVQLGPSSTVELHGRTDVGALIVRVHGGGSLIELRDAMTRAAAGVPFGHEAAVDLRWIAAQDTGDSPQLWSDTVRDLLDAAGRRGQADLDGRWIVGPIVWPDDVDPVPMAVDTRTTGDAG